MTDYNDGNWHDWNGGECPVHPKSEIEAQYFCGNGNLMRFQNEAAGKDWNGVFLFRVIKAHREPRVFWVNEYGSGFGDLHATQDVADRDAAGDRIACHRVVIE